MRSSETFKNEEKTMKILSIMVGLAFMATSVFAAETTFTGNDYLKLSKRQRVSTVSGLIQGAKKGGVTIKKDPVFYCKGLDNLYAKNPKMKAEPLITVLKTLMIMEYDWDQKGMDKEKLARNWLGEPSYNANKARLNKR